MPQIIHPVEAQVIGEHRVRIRFEDGAEGELDFSGFSWRGVFAPLKDPSFFALARVDPQLRTLAWPNGADLAPETLHNWVAQGVERVPG
ncbi:MAG: DUF2442 domain-containing protein [Solirubrobacterales bacterium]|nr:DUF2442 domain-containing protein [Solirubrobacterales bacterium]